MASRPKKITLIPLLLIALTLPVVFNGCFQAPTIETETKTSNPWSQGVPTDSAPPLDSGTPQDNNGASPSCFISMPNSILQNQELRVTVTSSSLAKFQVSTNSSDYVELGTSNGVISWAPNLFAVGTYTLRFRGVTVNKQTIACSPNSQILSVVASTSATPPPPSSTNPTDGLPHTSYVPVVGTNGATMNFKALQNPANLQSVTFEGVQLKVLDYEAISSLQGLQSQLKFFLPPGTTAFDSNIYLFLAYQEGRGALKLYAPPTVAIANITPAMVYASDNIPNGSDYSKVFSKLSSRGEVLYYSAGAPANFWLLSSSDRLSPELPYGGGYAYGNFQYPGGQFQRSLWKVYVKAACYEKWYASPNTKWDANGNPAEGVAHTCN